jgi:hypothetical protein
MLLKDTETGWLVEVLDLGALYNPFAAQVLGQHCAGEELQDPTYFLKSQLVFPSGEPLPRCWLDPRYRGEGATAAA